jgi:hypothetical protein
MRVPPIHAPRQLTPHPIRFEPRVPRHLRTLGILWCVWGAYRAVLAVLATIYLMDHSSRWAFNPWGPIRVIPFFEYNPWLRTSAPFIAILTILGAVASLAAGLSLLQLKPWARSLAMVLGILILVRIPFGTALGIYTLWVLAPTPSAEEYDTLTRR